MAFVNEPSGRRLLSGYRTRSCVLFCARLCTFLEVYPACCSILKKQLKFLLDGDMVIQLLIFYQGGKEFHDIYQELRSQSGRLKENHP